MSPVAPAIVNAIQDAIGVRLFSIPITPAKIFDVLGNSK
jgi:CO/xanthine dehydrogenase Mo-binding subunit